MPTSPDRWKRIKAHFTHRLVTDGVPAMRHRNGEYALWQRRFCEHTIRNESDFERHVDYVHFNPSATTLELNRAATAHFMKWLIVAIAVLGASYAAYTIAYPTYSYRWRITIEVETSSGTRTGSSVLETTTIQYPAWLTLGANSSNTSVRGEAVFVDLGNGRNLVALLALGPRAEDGSASSFAPRSFFTIQEGNPAYVKWSKELSTMTGRRPYAGDKRPTLVTFANPNDPASVREVPFDDPQSVLGPDVRSVRAWIDLTRDPVTKGLEAKLPWIGKFESANVAWFIVREGKYGTSSAPLQVFKRRGE